MLSPAAVAPVAVGWAAVAYRSPVAWRRRHQPTQRTVWLALLCLSIALSLDQGPVYKAIDSTAGIPNLDNLIAYPLGLTASFFGQSFLWHSAEPGAAARVRVGRRKICLCLVLGIMISAFALGPSHERDNPDFGSTQAHGAAADVYWLAFLSYALFALYELVSLCLRFSRMAQGRSLRLGLRLVAAGGVVVAIHFAYQYSIYLLFPAELRPSWRDLVARYRTCSTWRRWLVPASCSSEPYCLLGRHSRIDGPSREE